MSKPTLPPPPEDAAVQDVIVRAYQRTLTEREVTFTCQECGRMVTQLHYPGPQRRYCSRECVASANRWASLLRMRQLRARRKLPPQDP